jgi:threonine dehydrogenase-like Zn-dependent dehydrogenase
MTTVAPSYFLTGPHTLESRPWEPAVLPADWARVRFRFCGLCGSDLSMFEGRQTISYPTAVGHEFIAEVVECGEAVDRLSPGDLVTSDLNYRCGRCEPCLTGRSHLCDEGQIGLFSNRGFAGLGDIHESYLLRVDAPLAPHLALAEPLSCVLHGESWANLRASDEVLVVGAGGMGSCMAFALCNREQPVPFDITDEMPSRLSLIAGAVDPIGTAVPAPRGEYDVVFDLSGSESGLRMACERVKRGGKVCSLSHLEGYTNGEFLLPTLTPRDATFTVTYLNGELENLQRAATMLGTGWGPRWDAIIEIVPLRRLPEAYQGRRQSSWCKTMIQIPDPLGA